ncbi:hypothetical protein ACLI1C_03960 [Devosia sp. XGJD_8]|jgi:hypothetical protein|uniref:hypothetical protein n=1 Tax=Devosia sp. XGJD_8 TaxID=3391187 RepID=UPI0039853FC8
MRVPSIGLPLDERRIVREGYRLAERMLAGYEDPPGPVAIIGKWLAQLRVMVLARLSA